MAYIRYKELTRSFNFSKALDRDAIPEYVKEYIYDGETILAVYKVGKDYGVFTDKKMVLFDNSLKLGGKKEITTIPYSRATTHSIVFYPSHTEIYILMETSNPLYLKFVNMKDRDKLRVRVLYNAMSAAITGEKIPEHIKKRLVEDDFDFED